ncbi:MAG: type II secretion system F family protein [Thermoguttaceae bacterium]
MIGAIDWPALAESSAAPLAVFAATALAVFVVGRLVIGRPSREQARLRHLRLEAMPEVEADEGFFGSLAPALAAQIPESEQERREFQQMLRQAGLYDPHAPQTIYALRFVCLVVPLLATGVCVVLASSQWTLPILITGVGVAGFMATAPRLYVYLRRRRRMQRIREALPDTLDMLGMCVSGGLALGASLEQVARRMTEHPECAMELLLLKRQAELGSIKNALADFSARVDLPETAQLAGLLARSTHLGTELVGSLASQADHLRLARRQTAAAEANKTPVKLVFPIMFCFAPAVLILLMAPAVMQLRDFLVQRSPAESFRRIGAQAVPVSPAPLPAPVPLLPPAGR